jgi:hypothetical protein
LEAIMPPPVRICPKCALRFISNKAKRKHRYGPNGAFCKLPHILRREGMVQVDGIWRKGNGHG